VFIRFELWREPVWDSSQLLVKTEAHANCGYGTLGLVELRSPKTGKSPHEMRN